jgi:hypothetical protein
MWITCYPHVWPHVIVPIPHVKHMWSTCEAHDNIVGFYMCIFRKGWLSIFLIIVEERYFSAESSFFQTKYRFGTLRIEKAHLYTVRVWSSKETQNYILKKGLECSLFTFQTNHWKQNETYTEDVLRRLFTTIADESANVSAVDCTTVTEYGASSRRCQSQIDGRTSGQ